MVETALKTADESFTLEEVLPVKAEFHLEQMNKTYELRRITLEDKVYFEDKFGKKSMLLAFDIPIQWAIISQIVFRLLKEEDKKDFIAKEIYEIDEDGIDKKVTIGGHKLFLSKITGMAEATPMLAALSKTMIDSEPVIKELLEKISKKKMTVKEIEKLAGQASLTQSQVSTDTDSTK